MLKTVMWFTWRIIPKRSKVTYLKNKNDASCIYSASAEDLKAVMGEKAQALIHTSIVGSGPREGK